ncbi:MAG TPA: carbonate dehydratase [Terriglobia bacterium]|jgi:carbonic anhydrase
MQELGQLFENNRQWVAEMNAKLPGFFENLARQQTPEYLWIGCADSRVPANEIVGLRPGELFVHRNISNVVAPDDANCLSVIQYAVDVLHVRHIIVCGHYGCGGVQAALEDRSFGLADLWIENVCRVREKYLDELNALPESGRFKRLCELNVIEQVLNVAQTRVLRHAWARNQRVTIHGWIYAIENGLLRDLNVLLNGPRQTLQIPAYHE